MREIARCGDVSRRTGLFIVSYLPLAVMFAVLRRPSGWPAIVLIKLAVTMVTIATLTLFAPAVVTVTGRLARWTVRVVLVIVLVIVLAIALYGHNVRFRAVAGVAM
jgi:hypothetical protein